MLDLNYITDATGKQIAVQIAMSDWLLFEKQFQEFKRKLVVLQGIKDALKEVDDAKKEGRELQSLKDFLSEC
ncbi:MAG: hypothetical protein IPN95_05660 [Bacteroidetes bacterium]|nr:hypothetical protein [Bacteroidota bacterium]